MSEIFDVIIVGAGAAGLTAGLYTTHLELSTLLLENDIVGGELVDRDVIENYPGFPDGILGSKLSSLMINQLMRYKPEIVRSAGQQIELEDDYKIVKTIEGDYVGKTVILAGGTSHKKLGIPGEEDLLYRGVMYCAICEGPDYAGKVVAVAGGGDSGVIEGLFLTRYASEVIIIEMTPQLNAAKALQGRVSSNPKIEVMCNTKIEKIIGNEQVTGINTVDVKTGRERSLDVDGVLIRVGLNPNTAYLEGTIPLDNNRQILVNENMETEIVGIFAAGDIRHNSPVYCATAVGDGATAAISVQKYLRRF